MFFLNSFITDLRKEIAKSEFCLQCEERLCLIEDVLDNNAVSGVNIGKQQQTKESIFSSMVLFFFNSNYK